MRVSLLHRDFGHRFADAGALERPAQWTADWVRHRLVEALMIEKRLPDKRIGPAMVRNTWKLDTTDSFSDRVAQVEAPRQEIFEQWGARRRRHRR